MLEYLKVSEGADLKSEHKRGVKLVNSFVKSLEKQGLLPHQFPKKDTVAFGSKKELSKSSETFVLQPFTNEEKKTLKKDGYLIYPFTLKTIKTQKEAGKPLWHVIDTGPEFEAVTSMVGQVAFYPDPRRFFIPESNNRSLEEQLKMIEEYGKDLRQRLDLPDNIQAVMGHVPDYTQLAFTYLEKTGEYLFEGKYGYNYARTKTPTSGSNVASVGGSGAGLGLRVLDCDRARGSNLLFAVPLVVSIKTR